MEKAIEFIESLSGGNHELFHSNILAYIARNHKEYFKSIFGLDLEYEPIEVRREKDNFDISISKNDKYWFVLENKMKSFPDIKQLERYNDKIKKQNKDNFENCKKILLTMAETDADVHEKGWIQLSYKELASKMKEGFKHLTTTPPYLGQLLRDYIIYIEHLSSKMENWKKSVSIEDNEKANPKEVITLCGLRPKQNPNNFNKWESLFKVKFQFDCIGDQIRKKINNKDYCQISAGVIRGTPFLAFDIKFKKGKILKTEEIIGEKDIDTYWIQAYTHEIERGFVTKYDVKKELKDKSKRGRSSERLSIIESVWNLCKVHEVFGDIGRTYFDNRYFNKEEFIPYPPKNTRKTKYRAYLYDEAAMVYFVEEINKTNDKKISDFINSISEEINSIVDHYVINNKETENK